MENEENLKSQIGTSSVNQNLENLIYEIRGKQVMLDADVARLYQVETKRVNEVIKRNINRFPESFCFKLTDDEFNVVRSRSQIATLNKSDNYRGKNMKYLPYALTEQGIMMLSGLLRSDVAVRVNIQIIDAFVEMRRYFADTVASSEILVNHENRLLKIENTLDSFKEKPVNKIFFEGELYDAHSLLLDILGSAANEIVIIDNYVGKVLLDILKGINKKITVVSRNINKVLREKNEKQYKNIVFVENGSFHDRFIIIDRAKLYVCGASFKDLGKKCFAISEFVDSEYLERVLMVI